jgi:uncharacterized membrane protein (UPF0136 family)
LNEIFAALTRGMDGVRVGIMKRKNLADVLLKILGLYFCLNAIPSIIIGTVFALISGTAAKVIAMVTITKVIEIAIASGVQAVVGIYLILKSRKIADRWFQNEDE